MNPNESQRQHAFFFLCSTRMLEMHQSIENKIAFGIISSALSQFWLNWLCHDDFVIYSVPHKKRAHENLVKWILTLNRAKSTLCMICGWVCENKNGITTEITRLHLNDFLSYVFVCISQTLALGKQYKQTNKHSSLPWCWISRISNVFFFDVALTPLCADPYIQQLFRWLNTFAAVLFYVNM